MEIKNLGQLIQMLATKAGIDGADMHLVHVLSNSELSRISLHGDMAKAMSENLISLDEAKSNHPQIGNVYKAQALNGFDKKMDEVAVAAGLDESTVAALKGVKNSYKRFEMLMEIIQKSKFKIQKEVSVAENSTGFDGAQPDKQGYDVPSKEHNINYGTQYQEGHPQGAPLREDTLQQSQRSNR